MKKVFETIENYPWIVFLFLGLVALFWVPAGYFADGGDAVYPVSPLYILKNSFSLINHYYAGVSAPQAPSSIIYAFVAWLTSLPFGISLGQKILFYILATTPAVGMYFLLEYIFVRFKAKNYRTAAFIGALFYMANTFLIFYLWRMLILAPIFLYALLPLIILFYFKSINNKKFYFWFFFVSLFTSPNGSNIAFPLAFWSVLFIFVVLDGLIYRRTVKGIMHYLKMAGIFILANFWWILPQLILAKEARGNAIYADTIAITQLASARAQIQNVISLASNWWFRSNDFAGRAIYSYPIIKQMLFLPFLLSIIPLIIYKKGKLKELYTILLPIFLLLILLLKGSAVPKGDYFLYLIERVPYFAMFRDPMQKFGTSFVIIMTICLSISTYYILELLKSRKVKIMFSLFLILLIVIISWPFWIGGIINNKAVKNNFSFNVKLPDWLENFDEKINVIDKNSRIISSAPEAVGMVAYNWPSGYFGAAIYPYLIEREFIMPLPGSYRSGLVEGFYRRLKVDKDSASKIAQVIGANYLFIQKDLNLDYLKKTLPIPYDNLVDNYKGTSKFETDNSRIQLGENSLVKLSDKSRIFVSNPDVLFCGQDNSYLDFFILKYGIKSIADCGQKNSNKSILILPVNSNNYDQLYLETKKYGLQSYSQNEFKSIVLRMEKNLEFGLPEISQSINQSEQYQLSILNRSNLSDVKGKIIINDQVNQFTLGGNDILDVANMRLDQLIGKTIRVELGLRDSLIKLDPQSANNPLNRNWNNVEGKISFKTTESDPEMNYLQPLPELDSDLMYKFTIDANVTNGVTRAEVGYFDGSESYKNFHSIQTLVLIKNPPVDYSSMLIRSVPAGKKLYLNIWSSKRIDGISEAKFNNFELYPVPDIRLGLYRQVEASGLDSSLEYVVDIFNNYKFKVGAEDRKFNYVVLDQDFSKNWKLFYHLNNKWQPVPSDQHSIYNTYANAWDISNLPKGDLEFKIIYEPQKYLYVGILVFIVSAVGLVFISFRKK